MKRAVAVGLASLVLAGCGGGDDEPDAPATAASACGQFEAGADERTTCESAFDLCTTVGVAKIAKDSGAGGERDPREVARLYAERFYGSSGTASKVGASVGCRAGLGG